MRRVEFHLTILRCQLIIKLAAHMREIPLYIYVCIGMRIYRYYIYGARLLDIMVNI